MRGCKVGGDLCNLYIPRIVEMAGWKVLLERPPSWRERFDPKKKFGEPLFTA